MSDLVKKIIEPVSEKSKENSEEAALIVDFLNEEIMKVGTLQHGNVDWQAIQEKSIWYLLNVKKDFRILSYLILTLQNNLTPQTFLVSLDLLCKFARIYWESGDTKKNKNGSIFKQKIIKQVLERSLENSRKLEFYESDLELLPQIAPLQRDLDALVKEKEVPFVSMALMFNSIKNGLELLTEVEKKHDSKSKTKKQATSDSEKRETFHKNEPALGALNLTSDREVKQAYLKLAKYTNEVSPENSLGYRVRRFGLWHSIQNVPPVNKKGVTEMTSVPADRVSEYKDLVTTQPSKELLERIEHTIVTSPFWLTGSYLAAECANNLAYRQLSEVIREETQIFVNRVPGLLDGCFSDGTPFADEETKKWLVMEKIEVDDSENHILISSTVSQDDYEKLYVNQGLEFVLNKINVALENSKEPREAFHLKLLYAGFLMKSGLFVLAQEQLSTLLDTVSYMGVIDWEPSFFYKLKKLNKMQKEHK